MQGEEEKDRLLLSDAAWWTWPHSTANSVARGLAANDFIVSKIASILLIRPMRRELFNYLFSWVFTILVIFIAVLHNAVTQEQSRLSASKMQSEEGREGTAPKPFQVSSHSSGTRTHGPALFWFIVCGNWQLATRPCKGHAYLTTALGGCEGGGGFPKNLTEETTSVMYVASGQKSEKCSNVIFAFP